MLRKNKRGAIQLSVTTIVIVIIAVTLLSLGLLFVRDTFGRIDRMSDTIFTKGENVIGDIQHTGTFNSQTLVTVKQGDTVTFPIYVAHDGSAGPGPREFEIILTPNGNFENYVMAKVISPPKVTLDEGKEVGYVVEVGAISKAPLTLDASYQVEVICTGCTTTYATGAFVIKVTKGGLF